MHTNLHSTAPACIPPCSGMRHTMRCSGGIPCRSSDFYRFHSTIILEKFIGNVSVPHLTENAYRGMLVPNRRCAPSYRPCVLPKRTRQSKTHTLVLDLDETLVHSEISKPPEATIPPTFTFTVDIAGTPQPFFVWVRPGLHDFLRAVSELYEVVVFTASQVGSLLGAENLL